MELGGYDGRRTPLVSLSPFSDTPEEILAGSGVIVKKGKGSECANSLSELFCRSEGGIRNPPSAPCCHASYRAPLVEKIADRA